MAHRAAPRGKCFFRGRQVARPALRLHKSTPNAVVVRRELENAPSEQFRVAIGMLRQRLLQIMPQFPFFRRFFVMAAITKQRRHDDSDNEGWMETPAKNSFVAIETIGHNDVTFVQAKLPCHHSTLFPK